MRIIASVVINRGRVVQSFQYKHFRPLGSLEVVITTLDRWGIDEILIQNISGTPFDSNGVKILRDISKLKVNTPITYSGGIRSAKDAVAAIEAGADRIALDHLVKIRDLKTIKQIGNLIGIQGVMGILPLVSHEAGTASHETAEKFLADGGEILDLISELMIIDVENEGGVGTFNRSLFDYFKKRERKIIPCGGLWKHQSLDWLIHYPPPGIAIDNMFYYSENSVQRMKKQLRFITSIRPEIFTDDFK